MGSVLSRVTGQEHPTPQNANETKKRKRDEEFDDILSQPRRKKLNTTSEYIYKTLFKAGEDSDVTLVALGRNWPLHRVYLRQSPYFESMFTGNWKESNDSVVHMTIMDDNITAEALELTLGSLYCDELSVSGKQVVGVLAAAVLLQLDPLIQYCTSIMRETVNARTLLHYYHVANRYGVVTVETMCVQWLEQCLLSSMGEHSNTLRRLPASMLQRALASPNLIVIQTEFSVYVLLKMWLFLQLHPGFDGCHDQMLSESHKFFKNRKDPRCFLDTAAGRPYRALFWQVRLTYVAYHYLDMEMLATDRILPHRWVRPAITRQWYNMLRITQYKDVGPTEVPESTFDRECARCGRVLANSSRHIWRWTGYNFDLDLVMIFDGASLKIKRYATNRDEHFAASNQPGRPSVARRIMLRMTLVSLNNQQQESFRQTTGIMRVSLGRNEELKLLELSRVDLPYPLLLSANFLVYTPTDTSPLVLKHELVSSSSVPLNRPRGRRRRRRRRTNKRRHRRRSSSSSSSSSSRSISNSDTASDTPGTVSDNEAATGAGPAGAASSSSLPRQNSGGRESPPPPTPSSSGGLSDRSSPYRPFIRQVENVEDQARDLEHRLGARQMQLGEEVNEDDVIPPVEGREDWNDHDLNAELLRLLADEEDSDHDDEDADDEGGVNFDVARRRDPQDDQQEDDRRDDGDVSGSDDEVDVRGMDDGNDVEDGN